MTRDKARAEGAEVEYIMQATQDIEKKLYDYARLQRRLKELQEQADEVLEQRNTLLDGLLKSPCLEDVRVQGGFISDPVFAAVQKMVDVYGTRIDAIRKEIVNLYYLSDDIMRIVNNAGLTEAEREYIQCRYFDGLRASQTAARMGYSEDHARKIKRSAIAKIRPLLAR